MTNAVAYLAKALWRRKKFFNFEYKIIDIDGKEKDDIDDTAPVSIHPNVDKVQQNDVPNVASDVYRQISEAERNRQE